jgi:hypothetical protein
MVAFVCPMKTYEEGQDGKGESKAQKEESPIS